MADFRKWLLALAAVVVLLSLGSSSANAQPAFTCVSNAGAPNIVRGEGVAELVGDLILNCTGGTPTTAGKFIPLSNVQLSLNTNVTSRIISNATGASEALIMIDEPFPFFAGNAVPSTASGDAKYNGTAPPAQLGCLANNNTNCRVTSTGVGVGRFGSYNGQTDLPARPGPHYNVFQGFWQASSPSTINWQGVPIDAPGTAGTRVIRITNIRANACLLGVSSTFIPTQIIAQIGVNGGATITINNPSQVLALAERGMVVANGSSTYTQCVNVNDFLITGGPGSPTAIGSFLQSVSATEGFGYSFKPRNYAQILAAQTGPAISGSTPGLQNIPGFTYRTESGFIPGQIGDSNGKYTPGGSGIGTVGLATQGTQITFAFAGVQPGVSLYVPGSLPLTGLYGDGTPHGVAVLLGGDGTGNPNALTVSGTTGSATYEIWYSDPSVTETLTVPVYLAYISNTAQNLPGPGTGTVAVNFSPLSSTPTASSSAAIPRFCQPNTAQNLFSIASCTCNLLFPFVTNQAGFDTGVAIANTSLDTLNGVIPQQGLVTLSYYGNTTGGGAAPPTATTTSQVPAGGELIFTLSGGGGFGIPATPGFQGYIVAQANFQYCHGFAFISDAGAQKLAEGYLAIQLDMPGLYRTGVPGENLGH